MKTLLETLTLFLALGCAGATPNTASAAQEPGGGVAAQDAEAPIRFGDPVGFYDEPFFPGATYDPAIPTPDAIVGQKHGTRLSHHHEILACFRTWADASSRVELRPYARTHEGRELVYAVITSPANHARLDEILADVGRLADPRGLSDAQAEAIVSGTPAVAWMGYSIHGDELSGCDAAVAFGYHLIASTDAEVTDLLDDVVIVIDPILNPDGRERIVSMVEQSAGRTPSLDHDTMQRGRWPYGRGNHYLFDMNRDWMAGTQPETQGRWRAVSRFHPQLFVDAHEMGSLDTFLLYPQNEPINQNFPDDLVEWQRRYAEGVSRAFDRHGWGYYTREWADGWAPFYSDAWGSLIGAIGLLYEQARTAGFPLRRESGEVLTYREAVHHQAVASLANVETLAELREEALRAYLATRSRNVAADTPGNDRVFLVRPGKNGAREADFLRTLVGQGIEVFRAEEEFEAGQAVGLLGAYAESQSFPAGTLIVPARQPLGSMVRAYLEFDPRMDAAALKREREDLERTGATRIYDLTAWSLPHALDLDGWWADEADVEQSPATQMDGGDARLVGDGPAVGWVVPGWDDASVGFAARAMDAWLQVHLSDKDFQVVGRGEHDFPRAPRGSLLVRLHENEGNAEVVEAKVMRAAREAGVRTVYRVATGLAADQGPDLGGGHFRLLARPRVALLSNAPVAEDMYGHLWWLLDTLLGEPLAILDAQQLGSYDLRRYNVLVLPPHYGDLRSLLEEEKETLETWVQGGGTLVACGNSAAALTSERVGLSQVVLRRDALENLTPYRMAAEREWAARKVEIDEALVWGDEHDHDHGTEGEDEDDDHSEEEDEDPYAEEEVDEDHDAWLRTFSPYGVTLRGVVDEKAWITAGAEAEMPLYYSGGYVYLSRDPVRTPVRLAESERVRLGGLVWPEARERLGGAAWLTVESSGSGQIVLFAGMPGFRGYHRATGRLFANAVVYGPGAGASQPIGW